MAKKLYITCMAHDVQLFCDAFHVHPSEAVCNGVVLCNSKLSDINVIVVVLTTH